MVSYEQTMEDRGLGKLSMHPNEDVEDEVVADVISSAMIDEGDDCDDFDREKNESKFIWEWGIKHQWPSRV